MYMRVYIGNNEKSLNNMNVLNISHNTKKVFVLVGLNP